MVLYMAVDVFAVGENIHSHVQQVKPPQAAERGPEQLHYLIHG